MYVSGLKFLCICNFLFHFLQSLHTFLLCLVNEGGPDSTTQMEQREAERKSTSICYSEASVPNSDKKSKDVKNAKSNGDTPKSGSSPFLKKRSFEIYYSLVSYSYLSINYSCSRNCENKF